MFLSLDGTFFVQLVNFALFFALLTVLFWRPLSEGIRKRREYINGVTADYDRYQAEANALRQNAERVRAEARREAEQLLMKSRADASNKTAQLAADCASKVQTTIEDAQRTVEAEFEAARASEDQLVGQLAGLMVERTLTEVTK